MLSELGNHLKEARLEKNYSLDDLQQLTKIQKRYLVGIEEGNYAVMPGNFYVRAFIKQYAEAVGLDPEQLFDQFGHEIPNTYHDDLPEQLSRVKTHKQMPKSASKALELLPKALVISALIIVAIIVYVLVQNVMDSPANSEEAQGDTDKVLIDNSGVEPTPVEEAPSQDESDTNGEDQSGLNEEETKNEGGATQKLTAIDVSGNTTNYELTNTDQFSLKIEARGQAWIEVYNSNGDRLFYDNMYADDEQIFDLTEETEVTLSIGATNNVSLFINDEQLQYEVSPDEKVSQRFKIVYKKSE